MHELVRDNAWITVVPCQDYGRHFWFPVLHETHPVPVPIPRLTGETATCCGMGHPAVDDTPLPHFLKRVEHQHPDVPRRMVRVGSDAPDEIRLWGFHSGFGKSSTRLSSFKSPDV